MKCLKCGIELPEDAEFCFNCGEKIKKEESQDLIKKIQNLPEVEEGQYCPYCGTANSSDAEFCCNCGKTIKEQKKKKRIGIKMVGALVTCAVVVVGVIALFGRGKTIPVEQNVLYTKTGKLLQFDGNNPEKEAFQYDAILDDSIIEFTNKDEVKISEDGKYIIYPSYTTGTHSDGYRLNVAPIGKDEDTVKIDSNVLEYMLIDNEQLIFLDNNYSLYLCDFEGNREKIASNVFENEFYISEDKKNIVWVAQLEEGFGDVYWRSLDLKEEKKKLASNLRIDGVTSNLSYIYLSDGDGAIYVIEELKEKKKIDTNAYWVYSSNEDYFSSDNMYYGKYKSSNLEFIEDDMKKTDMLMKKPEQEDYQKASLEENEDGDYEKVMVTDWDAYEKACDEYQEKEFRDELRQEMESYEAQDDEKELYSFDGKNSILIDENYIFDVQIMNKGLIYQHYNLNDIEKVKLSEIDSLSDAESLYNSRKIVETCLYTNDKKTILEENIDVCHIDEEIQKAYGYQYDWENMESILYEFSIGKEADGKMTRVDDLVANVELVNNGNIYYIADANEEGLGDLYCNKNFIDTDVQEVIREEEGVIYYAAEASEYGYTLKSYDGKKVTTIAENVACEKIVDENHIYALCDYDWENYKGDLAYYDGEKTEIFEEDVIWLVSRWTKEK